MFGNKSEMEIKELRGKVRCLKEEVAELKFQKDLKLREAEHLVKMKLEKQDIEYQKKATTLSGEFNKKEMDLQHKYFEEIKNRWHDEQKNIKELYNQILKRLPDVSMHIEKEIGK